MNRPAAADPLIGSVIGDRYEVIRKIAKGGMGTIYEVRNIGLGRSFALKTLTAEAAEDHEVLVRFRREAEIVAKLRHPNIVEVVDWDSLEGGAPYLVMEYLRGEPLAARVRRGPVPWPELALIADQVLAALSVAHRAGVVHRDLKPENIFLTRDDEGEERAKLLDFGISKLRDSKTFATTDARLLGTPAYMAPEQAEGRTDLTGPGTDVWAVGAILYEMATGKVAFDAPNTPAILYRVCHGEIDPLTELRPDAPAAFVQLVSRALTTDVTKRPTDIERLRSQLRDALRDLRGVRWAEPLRTRFVTENDKVEAGPTLDTRLPESIAPTVAQRTRRRWPIVVALAGVVALGAAATYMFVMNSSDEPKPVAQQAAPPARPLAMKPPPPPVPAPAPETIDITIATDPPHAFVMRDGVSIGDTPFTSTFERSDKQAHFVLRLAHYQDLPVDVDLRKSHEFTLALKREPSHHHEARKPETPPPAAPEVKPPPPQENSPTHAPDGWKK